MFLSCVFSHLVKRREKWLGVTVLRLGSRTEYWPEERKKQHSFEEKKQTVSEKLHLSRKQPAIPRAKRF